MTTLKARAGKAKAAIAIAAFLIMGSAAQAASITQQGLINNQGSAQPHRHAPALNLETGAQSADRDYTDWGDSQQLTDQQDRFWTPSAPHHDLRDGSPPPWDNSRFGR